MHLLRLTFGGYPRHLPLFDHEVIYKTIKATFRDVKEACLTPEDYDDAAPMFLYRVDRGSGIYEFFAELKPLILTLQCSAPSLWGVSDFSSKSRTSWRRRLRSCRPSFLELQHLR